MDLRSSKTQYDQIWDTSHKWQDNNQQDIIWDTNTTIKITTGHYFQNLDGKMHSVYRVQNNATVTFDVITTRTNFVNMMLGEAILGTNSRQMFFTGDGTFIINADVQNSNLDDTTPFLVTVDNQSRGTKKIIVDSTGFIFKASGNLGTFFQTIAGPSGGTRNYFNSQDLIIDMDNNGANKSNKKYVFLGASYYGSTPQVGFNVNPNDFSKANSQTNTMQLTGSFGVAYSDFYAHFTNATSFLKGNIELIQSRGSSLITFTNGSSMTGDIDAKSDGIHSITFDNANFIGTVKNSATNGDANKGINTTVTFTNTAGKTFGNGTSHIVDTTYKGSIIGVFDVSANSTTLINGGSDGSKGFFGSGNNTLIFDFKGNAKSGLSSQANKQFTIGGGNTNSVYVMSGFQQNGTTPLDLSSLNTNGSSLFSKIKDAGVNVAVDTQSTTTNNHLNGTLFFQKTNIQVNSGDNALFAKKENIVGSSNDLNGLALGAMFGNATWNDANKDGYITADEIIANAGGENYKLTASSNTLSNANTNDQTSTGNIGNTSDSIKKQVAFIFTGDTYTFGGDNQGYSGTIAGGTTDSKYYFANAGYLNRSQIEDAQGDLVLFNTAFRGDLGVNNKNVSVMLDFSNGRNGLRAETGDSNANIVGSGSKNIIFNFTDNTLKDKFVGAVIGDATKTNTNSGSSSSGTQTDSDTATYTMLNLKKYSSDNTLDGDGSLKITTSTRAGGSGNKTLIDAIQEAGLTNFNNPSGNNLGNSYGTDTTKQKDSITDISEFSKTATTLALRGTSLDATNIIFNDYKYDFVFGSNIGEIEGVSIQDSKLKGSIDLSSNTNTGHSIILRGNSIDGSVEIKFNSNGNANFGSSGGGVFVYDDSTATRNASSSPTLKLGGITQTNYLTTNSELNISNTSLEGNLWADSHVAINLNFSNGNTWKMDESGFYLSSGGNIIVNGKIENLTTTQSTQQSTPPILKLRINDDKKGDIELINTGAKLYWDSNKGMAGTTLANTLDLRGTTIEKVTYNNSVNGLHGTLSSGKVMTMTFASGSNLETIVQKGQQKTAEEYYQITDEGINTGYLNGEKLTHTGSYSDGIYDGNYVADSYAQFKRLVTDSTINITFIGDGSKRKGNGADWSNDSRFRYGNNSKLTLVNVKDNTNGQNNSSTTLDANQIGGFLSKDNLTSTITVTLQGTSLKQGGNLMKANNSDVQNQNRVTFDMTFVKETSQSTNDNSTNSTYVNATKYGNDLALTNANGALSDSVLKVAQSSLEDGLDFGSANFNVLFVGDASQSLGQNGSNSQMNVFKGGSATSTVTFRDSNLNAGNSTSSLQNIAGTIAFDLSHTNEDMQISGTLSNMFGNGSNGTYNGTGKYQTIFGNARGDQADGLTINKLVFVKMSDLSSANTLTTLQTNGIYFNDTDTFGSLASNDYSTIGYIKDLSDSNNSSLTLAGGSTIALKDANQEIVFIGANSHGFDASDTTNSAGVASTTTTQTATKLGDSTGSTLTFIDAGTLKVENLINKDSGGTQQGKGTINLIGSTKIELQDITTGVGARNSGTKTLTLYSANNSTAGSNPSVITDPAPSSTAITGEGIIINAVFTGTNALGDDTNATIQANDNGSSGQAINNGHKASTANIGQAGEQTTYHLLFDYTSSNLTFGVHHAYTGTITGLTSDSVIKFKNAGYINNTQITNTNATILVDNTQIKGDFRGDFAILDFRNGNPAISGNILTSDTRTGQSQPVLSQKVLTFDLTNKTSNKLAYDKNIQAGYKVAPTYTDNAQSILTFQNASSMSLGDDSSTARAGGSSTNPSAFIQSLAKDIGFSGIANAKTEEPTNTTPSSRTTTVDSNTSYILKGTKLAFQGTNISGDAITENNYELDLSFDMSANRGSTALGETLNASKLTANSITMGQYDTDKPLGLSLSFKDAGSLAGATKNALNNTLAINLANNARFNLVAESSNGNIGTIILNGSKQTRGITLPPFGAPAIGVSTDSSLSITAGSLGFVGDFIQADNTPASSTAGAINVAFDGTNKVYGSFAGRGEMDISISGDALFSKEVAQGLGYDGRNQESDVLIDASNAKDSNNNNLANITLAHTSGTVEVKGATLQTSALSQNQLTALSINEAQSHIALQGAFDIGLANLTFDTNNKLILAGDTALFVSQTGINDNSTITIAEGGFEAKANNGTPLNLILNALGRNQSEEKLNLNLVNLGENVLVTLTSNDGQAGNNNRWNKSTWNIRGTNLFLKNSFTADKGSFNLVFAKGSGRNVVQNPAEARESDMTLDQLTDDNKIAISSLGGGSITYNSGDEQDTRSIALESASFTFIGRESINQDNLRIDSIASGGKVTFGYYNTLIKSGTLTLDNTRNSSNSSQEVATILGTDTFNLSAIKQASGNWGTGVLNSTINAVFVNGTNTTNGVTQTASTDNSITGVKYINANFGDAALQATLAQYATSNAGGALSENILKTLESKAYGNITMENTVTATMKFIGENSHSFDGKTIVEGSGTSAKFYAYTGSGSIDDVTTQPPTPQTGDDWKQIDIGTNGVITLKNPDTPPTSTTTTKYAQLIGGNANSRFDFDHTTVALDLVKFAGGKTYVYNSSVSGNIAVTANGGVGNGSSNTISTDSSTTLIFNAKMTEKAQSSSTLSVDTDQELTDIAKKYIDYHYTSAETGLGINLDLNSAHQMTKSNLTNGSNSTYTLGKTDKQTNIVLIGKDSVKTENASATTSSSSSSGTSSNNNGAGIDLSFLPTDTKGGSEKYSYTIIGGGELDGQYLNTTLGNDGASTSDASGSELTVFGKSKVTLVDTYVVGERNFAQVGFIDTGDTRNQKSTWGGANSIEQFLIFDFHNGTNNQALNSGSGNVITNQDPNSRYIFTSIFANNSNQTLTLSGSNNLKTAINNQLKSSAKTRNGQDVISSNVVGYLGLRGISIQGDIDENLTSSGASTRNSSGNSVDIVFNSTDNISYIDGFDESGKHTFEIKDLGYNKVANISGMDTDISGYAVLKASSSNGGVVSIKGTAHKDIVFIGKDSVEGGFDRLKIEGGSAQSNYTFYEVGTLSSTFLSNVGLYKAEASSSNTQATEAISASTKQATLGNFTFANSTINGDINVDTNNTTSAGVSTVSTTPENVLTFDNVAYSGTISGNLKKNLIFGANTNNVKIIGGSEASVYDFSNLSGRSINLDIDMKNSDKYIAPTITGFNGDVSLVGSIKLAKTTSETSGASNQISSFAFNDSSSWTLTDSSRVGNLSLSNTGLNYNLNLASAPRTATATQDTNSQASKDLRILEVGNLTSNGGQVLLGTLIDESNQANSKSDKIKASVINSGTLYVTAKDATLNTGSFDTQGENAIVLVTADTSYGEVKGAERKQGLSYVSTVLEHQVSTDNGSNWNKAEDENANNSTNSHRWVLSSFDTATNQELVDESGFIVSNPYRMLMIETNNLNKRMGDLRDDDYNQGAWIRVFNGSDSGEGSKNLYTNIQLGYDYGTPAIGAKNYSGVAFSTSIVDIDGNQYSGKANTYSLAAYNAYIADSGLYVDTIGKYLYTDQKLSPSGSSDSSFGSHALSLGVEVGYRAYMGESNFYIEPQAEAIGGIIFGVKDIAMGNIGGMDITGELKTTTTLNTRVGLVQGYSLKTESGFRADFRVGVSLVNEFVSESNPVVLYDGITEASTSIGNDVKAVVNVGTNLILTDQWRVYIDAERSFGGSRNVDYQANVGARFSFGDKLTSLPKPEKPLPLKLKGEEKKEQEQKTNTQEAK